MAYLAGGTSEYYSLSGDGRSVTYNASVAGSNVVELRGIKGTPSFIDNTVNLTADNFASNVSVLSNAGSYEFALSSDLSGKTFAGATNADTISNSGNSVRIKSKL